MKELAVEPSTRDSWIVLQSAVLLLLLLCSLLAAELLASGVRIAGLVIAGAGLASFSYLYVSARDEAARVPNLVTALRLLASVGAFLYVVLHGGRVISYALFLLLVGIEITDFLDGYLAKKVGTTSFGATWDMETDAFFLFLLSFIAHFFFGLGSWVLLIGAIRYIFTFVFRLLPRPSRYPPAFTLFARGVCVFAAGALISLTAPFVAPAVSKGLNAAAVVLLVLSFFLEAGLGARERRG